MYKIVFKGRDIEPILLSPEKGKSIFDQWVAGKLPARLVLKGSAVMSSDIKIIQNMDEWDTKKKPTQDHSADEREYLEFRRDMLNLPIEKRAQILRIPKLVWKAQHKTELPQDVAEKIKERQLEYFKENPNCIFANPSAYRDLVGERQIPKKDSQLNPLGNFMNVSVLKLVENVIRTDRIYSKRT